MIQQSDADTKEIAAHLNAILVMTGEDLSQFPQVKALALSALRSALADLPEYWSAEDYQAMLVRFDAEFRRLAAVWMASPLKVAH